MGAILPPDTFYPPDTPISGGPPSGPVGYILPDPTNEPEDTEPQLDEVVPEPETTVDSGGVVRNTPAPGPAQEVPVWTGRFPPGASITATYLAAGVPLETSRVGSVPVPPLGLGLKVKRNNYVIPGSVRFSLNGREYLDRAGQLVYDVNNLNNAGTIGGYINYSSGWAVVEDWAVAGDGLVDVTSLGLVKGSSPTNKIFFRTPGAPILQGSFTLSAIAYDDGTLLQASTDINGNITGTNVEGTIDWETGVVEIFFGEFVTAAGNEAEWWYNADAVLDNGTIFKPIRITPSSALFSAVVLTSIPLDPGILGLDPILLPSDGRVPIFQAGDSLMIVQRKSVEDAAPTAGAIVNLGLTNVKFVRVRDANGADVVSDRYSVDGTAGELMWANPLDLAAYTGPFTIEVMSYFKRLAADVEINGRISIASGAPFAMDPADSEIFLASKLIFQPDGGNQDLQALALNLFTQNTWTGTWEDNQQGDGTTGQFDDINFPIVMQNNGSVTERWRLEFVGTDTVNVIGETFGQILTAAPISGAIAPINPATGTPYFTIPLNGWSGGWQIGNIVRFNTLGANDPVWFVRSVQPGDAPELTTDRFIAHLQGDVSQE